MDERARIERERDDLAFMRHPELWPHEAFLPLKRRRNSGWDTAMLMSWSDDMWLLWEGKTMFDRLLSTDAEQVTRDGLEHVVARGWVVD